MTGVNKVDGRQHVGFISNRTEWDHKGMVRLRALYSPSAHPPTRTHARGRTHLARDPALHLDPFHRQRRAGIHQPKRLPDRVDLRPQSVKSVDGLIE